MATYLAVKKNARKGAYRAKAKMPPRSARTGKFLKRGSAKRSSSKPKSRRAKSRRSNLPTGYRFTSAKGLRTKAGRWKSGWSGAAKWKAPKKRKSTAKRAKVIKHPGIQIAKRKGKRAANPRRYNGKVRYRTRTNVVHKTKRLRNPVGFDSADSLKSLSTWGKVGMGVVFGLGGLVIAFGIPKALAVASGMDYFQRGWGGVVTAGVASVGVSVLVGMASREAGYALLVASLTGVGLLAVNAISAKAAQAVIPVNEATLAAMLPTFESGSGRGPSDYYAGGAIQAAPTQYRRSASSPSDALALAQARQTGRGPSDYIPGQRGAVSAEAIGREPSFHSRALAPKERF